MYGRRKRNGSRQPGNQGRCRDERQELSSATAESLECRHGLMKNCYLTRCKVRFHIQSNLDIECDASITSMFFARIPRDRKTPELY
jgi:hypothetical protein